MTKKAFPSTARPVNGATEGLALPDNQGPLPAPEAPPPRSWKVGVQTAGDTNWAYNRLRFPTKEAADAYGRDLWFRWTAVTAWESHPSDDEPTQPAATAG